MPEAERRGARTRLNILDPDTQASRCCALPSFDRRRWVGDKFIPAWMGASPRLDLDGADIEALDERDRDIAVNWESPPEPQDEGCPGAWYRTPFVASVLPYVRRMLEGNRVPNPRLDRAGDELVLEAVEALEVSQEAWRGEHLARLHPGGS